MKEHQARPNSEQRRISTTFADEELAMIDDWGFSRRLRNRAEVIRQLVFKALGSEPTADANE